MKSATHRDILYVPNPTNRRYGNCTCKKRHQIFLAAAHSLSMPGNFISLAIRIGTHGTFLSLLRSLPSPLLFSPYPTPTIKNSLFVLTLTSFHY